ncbi:MAG TPA: 2,3-bisphosphoglycerate-independent phosphoglycerate mutase [Polyangia bacterium]|jgi:2,3-bisphosphoglycerate-independent phosphoglycerate mutase|nr:2,3-bisphosphoglycerate-independent phosphoglycerate mutase [Polyangia bacterium]
MNSSPRAVLVILDGFGERPDKEGNAIRLARTPHFSRLFAENPWTLIGASGHDVGLPDGQMGNSEVGHLNLGAGRIVYQDIVRIDLGIKDGTFYTNPTLNQTIEAVKQSGGTLHLFGLTSPGNVHAALEHAYAVCALAKRRGLTKVAWHAFLDGRDTPPRSAAGYLREVAGKLREIGVGQVASAVGRYYAMDRDKRWERLEIAWKMLTRGEGRLVDDLAAAVEENYAGKSGDGDKEITDEFIKPLCLRGSDGKPAAVVRDGDAAFFWNFRADRARQLTLAFAADDFPYFDRGPRPKLAAFATMTQYDAKIAVPPAFPPQSLKMILGEVLALHGIAQLRTAETEKYAHVTYFFNGGNETPFPGEERVLVPSNRNVATYDLAPEMSAVPVTDGVVQALSRGKDAPPFILVNYANPDMVGHTGMLKPAVSAIETIDACIARVAEAAEKAGYAVFVTADHGNCETMIDPETGQPQTAHTTNPVPFLAIGGDLRGRKFRAGGRLADVAPTILEYLKLPQPPEMDAESLFARSSG